MFPIENQLLKRGTSLLGLMQLPAKCLNIVDNAMISIRVNLINKREKFLHGFLLQRLSQSALDYFGEQRVILSLCFVLEV